MSSAHTGYSVSLFTDICRHSLCAQGMPWGAKCTNAPTALETAFWL